MATADRDEVGTAPHDGAELEVLMTRVARELGKNARVEVVFGEPLERDHATVIPVATASLGIGAAGSAEAPARPGNVGAGLRVKPVGYIEVTGARVRFRRILPTWAFVTIALAIGTLGSLLLLRPRW